jgi:hypothetical protein
MSSWLLLNSAMQLAQGCAGCRSSQIKIAEMQAAAGFCRRPLADNAALKSAVEQTTGHLGKFRTRDAEILGLPRSRHIQFPQILFDVYQTAGTPDGSNKHLRIPFQVHDPQIMRRSRWECHALANKRAMLALHADFTPVKHDTCQGRATETVRSLPAFSPR